MYNQLKNMSMDCKVRPVFSERKYIIDFSDSGAATHFFSYRRYCDSDANSRKNFIFTHLLTHHSIHCRRIGTNRNPQAFSIEISALGSWTN